MANAKAQIIISAKDESKQAFASVQKGMQDINAMARNIDVSSFAKGLSLATASIGFVKLADDATRLRASIKNITDESIKYSDAFRDIQRISAAGQVDLADTARAYTRNAAALKEFGASQEQIATLTETVSLALKAQGASAEEASSTLLQLSQALGSGRLQGDELRSLGESAPILMRQLAKSIDVPVGALKELGSQGKITSNVLLSAFTDQKFLTSLRSQANEMRTVSGSSVELKNSLLTVVSVVDEATGVSSGLAKSMSGLASAITSASRAAATGDFKALRDALPGGGKSIVVDEKTGKATIDYIENITKSTNALKKASSGPDIEKALKDYDALVKSANSFANNDFFESTDDKKQKKLLELSTAFRDAVKNIDTAAPEYVAALKRFKEESDQILNGDKTKSKTNESKKAADAFVESLKKQAETLGLNQAQLLEYEAAHLKLSTAQKAVTEGAIESIKAFEQKNEAIKSAAEFEKLLIESEERAQELADSVAESELQNLEERQSNYARFYQELLDTNQSLSIDLIKNDKERAKAQVDIEHQRIIERINAMVEEQSLIDDLLAQENANYELKLKKVNEQSKEGINLSKELGRQFSSAFEDAVLAGKDLQSVLGGLLNDLAKMFLQAGTNPLFKSLQDGLSGIFANSGIIMNANGGVYSGAGISQFSSSVVNKPTLFPFAKGIGLMGEAGPEAILPLTRINGELGVKAVSGGGGDVYNVSVSVDATGGSVAGDNEKAVNLGQQIERAVKSVLLNEKRPGGLLA